MQKKALLGLKIASTIVIGVLFSIASLAIGVVSDNATSSGPTGSVVRNVNG